MFECEAHVRKRRKEIEFSSKSKELIYNLKYLLLRFGIISQVQSMFKCATNTTKKIRRKYYRLKISGEDVTRYSKKIGFVSSYKQKSVDKVLRIKNNTNIKIIPHISNLLKTLRMAYGLSQFSFDINRSSYQHYEKGDRNPSKEQLIKIYNSYKKIQKDNEFDPLVGILGEIANSNIFLDKIHKIE